MPTQSPKKPLRYPSLDFLRGFYVLLMIVFHYCFVLSNYGVLKFDFYRDSFWLNARLFIVTGFLTIVGISLALANRNGFRNLSFLKRLTLLIVYAVIVSIATYIEFGHRWVYFGILHFIAVASILGQLMVRFFWINIFIGLFIILFSFGFSDSLFNSKWINWIGLMTHKPQTEDYVPLFPWFGVVLIGIAIGNYLIRVKSNHWLSKSLAYKSKGIWFKFTTLLGKQAIHIYLLHIPIFIVLVELTFRFI